MNENNQLIDVSPINQQLNELAQKIIDEPDIEKSKQLISLFNWHMSKKNITRVQKLNNLYDDISDQMVRRVQTKADQFSHDDLLNYLKTVQGAIDTSTKNILQVEEPPTIAYQNNTQINVNIGESFDREAKERILAAVQATLELAQQGSNVNNPSVENNSSSIDNLASVLEGEFTETINGKENT